MSIEALIQDSQVAAVISNPRLPDNPIVACNSAFEKLTGYPREEVVGRNCRFLRGSGTDQTVTAQLRAGIADRNPVMVELVNYRKDGSAFRNAVMIAPIFGADGNVEYFLGSQVEVADAAPDRAAAARAAVDALPPRQREILQRVAAGRLNKQIAWELGLSERTVKLHRAAVLKGLGVRTSADAIRLAIEAGL